MSRRNAATDAVVTTPKVPRPRKMLVASLILLAFYAVMGVFVVMNPEHPWMQGFDDAWRAAVGVGPDSSLPGQPIPTFFQELGQPTGLLGVGIVLPIIFALFGRWRTSLFIFSVHLAGPFFLSQLGKNLANRPRPAADEAAGLFGPLFIVDHGSFPSGHAVSAGVMAVVLIALIPPTLRRVKIAVIVIAGLIVVGMIWQRTLINAHWVSDAIVGGAAGIGIGLLFWWLFWPWLRRDYNRPIPFTKRKQS